MTTQGGNQIYPFIRPLVATHEHLVRTLGFPISTRYEWPKFQDSTDSDKQKEAAPVSERWRHPKEIYSLYKSASGHTIKGKVPKKMWLLIVPMLLLVVSAYIGYQRVFKAPGEDVAKPKKGLLGEVATDKAKGGSDVTPEESRAAVRPTTAEEWRVALTPVVPGLPFTAPLFADKLEVVAHPQIFCAISGAEYDDLLSSHCSCLTEQGTRPSDIPDGLCRAIALNGYFDPTRAPRDDAASSASFVASDAGSVGASVVVSGDPAQIGSTSMGLVQGR
jgi:zona occludens toxin